MLHFGWKRILFFVNDFHLISSWYLIGNDVDFGLKYKFDYSLLKVWKYTIFGQVLNKEIFFYRENQLKWILNNLLDRLSATKRSPS